MAAGQKSTAECKRPIAEGHDPMTEGKRPIARTHDPMAEDKKPIAEGQFFDIPSDGNKYILENDRVFQRERNMEVRPPATPDAHP